MGIDNMSLPNDFPILISPVAAKAKPSDLQGRSLVLHVAMDNIGPDLCTLDHFEVTGWLHMDLSQSKWYIRCLNQFESLDLDLTFFHNNPASKCFKF
jgi:hypothetical protein